MVIRFIFVSQRGFAHSLINEVVELATHSKFSHVAIGFDDCIVEAKMPKVKLSEVTEFDNEPVHEVLAFEVSDAVYQEAYALAKSQLCKYYGLDDCIIGGLHDLLGINIDGIDISDTIDCSALGTMVARVLFPMLLQGEPCCEVTPEKLYEALEVEVCSVS